MARLLLPKILDIPDKLIPLVDPDVFNKYPYYLLKGGRGGAKSQSVARFILYLAEKYKIRVVCGRETQNSIRESVHAIMADLVSLYQLNFEVLSDRIAHRVSGSEVIFRGFREQGRFNIQGLEGVDIVWVDESQALTKQTLDVLIPTIRKPNSKVIFTMNPHVFNDPVVVMFSGREDCLKIDINYNENPHCSAKLLKEAEECQKLSKKDYEHIWLGKPLDQSDDSVFSMEDVRLGQNNAHALAPGYGIRLGGFDVARFGDDKCSDVVLQQMGALHWEEVHVDEWGKTDLNYTTGRILQIANEQKLESAVVDEDGIGAGPLDTLKQGRGLDYFHGFRNLPLSFQDNKYFANIRTLNAFKAKEMMQKGHLCIRDPRLIEELVTAFKYTFDHYQRRILIAKDVMKTKYGIKSPNRADAFIMAVSRIGEIKYKQERQYEPNNQVYSPEDNLFKIAGVR